MMIRSLAIVALTSSAAAFAPAASRPAFVRSAALSMSSESTPYYANNKSAPTDNLENCAETDTKMESSTNTVNDSDSTPQVPVEEKKAPASPKKKPAAGNHKDGLLSPLVQFMKGILGDEKLNKVRGKVIGMHSDVIGSFVGTSETVLGDAVLRSLFKLADKNGDGTINEEELQIALRSLGFSWLQEKQVKGIFKRADLDENGALDMDEWMKEAPKTLRTNLVKLAKKNGGDMGLLV